MSMLQRLLRRRSSAITPTNQTEAVDTPPPVPIVHVPAPYETPDPKGTSHLTDLPDEILINIFTRLDRITLTRCFRLCKPLHDLLQSSPAVSLHHLLLTNSLRLNPAITNLTSNPLQIPLSSAALLSTLRERLTRFRNFKPRQSNSITFNEPDGRLYEYLEGVLLRGVGGRLNYPREIAVYDLRKLDDWEDTTVGDAESDDTEMETATAELATRRSHKFDFEIADFAVDPGLDLLVIVEIRSTQSRSLTMHFHLLSLSTFQAHPLATKPILTWPIALTRPRVSLCFQICDDGLYVLHHHTPHGPHDYLVGWQWTTGRHAITLKSIATMSFESFVLLTPSSFVIPTIITHIDPNSQTAEELDNPSDLSWTHHLRIYAFPLFKPFSQSEVPPSHTPVHVATIDLPRFHVDILQNIPPPRLNIRTDPPPRHRYPKHPETPVSFLPDPESGIVTMEVFCQTPDDEPDPHFAFVTLKKTLINYLPAPTSPLLSQAFPRPAPIVSWETIAPKMRMFGPDLEPQSWVCYVYHNRWINLYTTSELRSQLRLYDFDPLRVRKEQYDRAANPLTRKRSLSRIRSRGDEDGVILVMEETVLERELPLLDEVRTGRELPYLMVKRATNADVALIDGERIVEVNTTDVSDSRGRFSAAAAGQIEVMDF